MEDYSNELMRPRVMVSFPYPGSPFTIGDILTLHKVTYCNPKGNVSEIDVDECQMIFMKLEWYENRTELEMPTYLRSDDGVFKVLQHFKGIHKEKVKCYNGTYDTTESYWHMQPASYEDYQKQIKR